MRGGENEGTGFICTEGRGKEGKKKGRAEGGGKKFHQVFFPPFSLGCEGKDEGEEIKKRGRREGMEEKGRGRKRREWREEEKRKWAEGEEEKKGRRGDERERRKKRGGNKSVRRKEGR